MDEFYRALGAGASKAAATRPRSVHCWLGMPRIRAIGAPSSLSGIRAAIWCRGELRHKGEHMNQNNRDENGQEITFLRRDSLPFWLSMTSRLTQGGSSKGCKRTR